MAASIAFDQTALAVDRAERTTIPWYIWLSVIGVTSAMIGVHWDISWHRSIGRDTFWTAPHRSVCSESGRPSARSLLRGAASP